ncbi:MAG TPA: 5-deoxy-glucuronate isomerase [Baekduia sp.]|nr:5-deoxy-glucuronate isomerase [Baekduia sp.]
MSPPTSARRAQDPDHGQLLRSAVSAPPGYEVYYLNVMAGPVRSWSVANDPDDAWTLDPATAG